MDFTSLMSMPPHFLAVRVAVLQEFPELLPVVVLHGTVSKACDIFPVTDETEDVPSKAKEDTLPKDAEDAEGGDRKTS